MGALGNIIKGSKTKIIPVKDRIAHFSDTLLLPLRPMIGVIGVAPACNEVINTGTPGHHGGNMDNIMVTEGAALYFPVSVDGALLAMGDVHAVMGDGEIGVTGLEIAAEVTVKVDVIKGKSLPEPVLENDEYWSVIVSRDTLDEAAIDAAKVLKDFLNDRLSMEELDIVLLMSLAADQHICQIVDPLKTIRYVIRKEYTGKISF